MRAQGFVGWLGLVVAGGMLLASEPGQAQDKEKVYHHVTSEKLEGILKALNLSFKKTSGRQDGIFFYDFERNDFKIRLHNYNGKDLWIDAFFNDKSTLEQVNGWNIRAKFSRAVLVKTGDEDNISLEAQLDCLGGFTNGMLRQFINRFDGEIAAFVKYLAK